ncbi:MAG: hypothetical protein GXO37_04715 [Chloroflexi bacterium]|nr:hypothetical protein [Chloroflexota bacterium]
MTTQDPLETIQNLQNAVERLAERVPGFAGYKARETRREADKLLRVTLAQRIMEQVQRLSEVQRALLRSGGLRWLDDVEAAVVRLQTLADQIRTASYGYAGVFDALKIDEPQLARLYAFDQQLFAAVDRLAAAIDRLQAAVGQEDFGPALADLMRLARETLSTFHRREEVLLREDEPRA